MSDAEIDAILVPIGFAGLGPASERLGRLEAEFAGVLGNGPVFVRLQGSEHFLSARPDDSLQFSRSGSRSGESRYRWEDRGDGIRRGYLKADE